MDALEALLFRMSFPLGSLLVLTLGWLVLTWLAWDRPEPPDVYAPRVETGEETVCHAARGVGHDERVQAGVQERWQEEERTWRR